MKKILFVCMGNICRSPAAENVMRHLVEAKGLSSKIAVDSAGTIGYHVGEPPDGRMSAAADSRGLTMTGRSRQIKANDLDVFDWVVTMDNANYTDVMALAKNEEQKSRIKKFCDYVSAYDDTEVPDPYYGGEQGFHHVLDLMDDGCQHILDAMESDE